MCIIISTCACTQLHDRGYMYFKRTCTIHSLCKLFTVQSDWQIIFGGSVHVCVFWQKLLNVYQHNLAQLVLANNEANILDSIDAYS